MTPKAAHGVGPVCDPGEGWDALACDPGDGLGVDSMSCNASDPPTRFDTTLDCCCKKERTLHVSDKIKM